MSLPSLSLDDSVARFISLASSERRSIDAHVVDAELTSLMAAVAAAEAGGLPPDQIRTRLAPARQIVAESPLGHRLQMWPRGYPGDFETIEHICRGSNLAEAGSIGHAIEAWALACPPVQQHRNKVHHQARLIVEAGRSATTTAPCRVVSVGCGPSIDLRMALARGLPASHLLVVLNDSDPEALDTSRAHLERAGVSHAAIVTSCDNVLTFCRSVRTHAPVDLAIAGGLFDYLDDRQCAFVIRTLYGALRPGGTLCFTNIAAGNPYRVCMEYLTDWRLLERTEADIRRLCLTAGLVDVPTIYRDATGLTLLVDVTRTT